jgi:pimeloyl-ACP methyl ester carboxylesterase
MYELDTILKVPLGGLRQKIHILGARRGNPILLFLHGGPGVPNRAGVMRSYRDLCDDFTLVAWDQRGTGGSYWGTRARGLTVERLVEDARELCGFLCDTLEQDKLSLVCRSWGTQLGTLLAHRCPQRVAAYVGSAQAVDGVRNEELSYAFALQKAQEAGNQEDVARLEAVGPPARGQYRGGFRGLMTQRNLMKKYGGYSQNQAQNKKGFVATFAKPMVQSGE